MQSYYGPLFDNDGREVQQLCDINGHPITLPAAVPASPTPRADAIANDLRRLTAEVRASNRRTLSAQARAQHAAHVAAPPPRPLGAPRLVARPAPEPAARLTPAWYSACGGTVGGPSPWPDLRTEDSGPPSENGGGGSYPCPAAMR